MRWPVSFPEPMVDGDVVVTGYVSDDAAELFEALHDGLAWEHILRSIPLDSAELNAMILTKLGRRPVYHLYAPA